jgi:hypothetical protein
VSAKCHPALWTVLVSEKCRRQLARPENRHLHPIVRSVQQQRVPLSRVHGCWCRSAELANRGTDRRRTTTSVPSHHRSSPFGFAAAGVRAVAKIVFGASTARVTRTTIETAIVAMKTKWTFRSCRSPRRRPRGTEDHPRAYDDSGQNGRHRYVKCGWRNGKQPRRAKIILSSSCIQIGIR